MCYRQQVENAEEGHCSFETAILRENAFPAFWRCLPIWVLCVNDEPMGARREIEYRRGLLRHLKDEGFGGPGGERGECAGRLGLRR